MEGVALELRPKFIVDEKGKKKAVLLNLKDYQRLEELIENLEDTVDLLRAEREAVSFIPYEKFRRKWLSLHH